jgi:uncharacterized protein YndB with AHSA1/START domain
MDTHVIADRDLVMARRILAPPSEVFAAWTQPDRIRQWFGPYCMSCPEAEVDLRPGGFHRALMRDANGKEYPAYCAIDAVEAPHRLVMRVVDESCGPLIGAVGTLTFEPDGEGTLFTVRYSHPTEEMRAAHEAMGFVPGWAQTLDKLAAHVMTQPAACPMATPLSPEHGWLHRMIGAWRYDSECTGPDGQTLTATGTERVHSLGGYWVVGESEGEMPGGGHARWTVSLGYDAGAKLFRGTFYGSMMPHMFVYEGRLSEDTRSLVLEADGPAMHGGGTARYRDTVTPQGDDARVVTSEVQDTDGAWNLFMTARFKRI